MPILEADLEACAKQKGIPVNELTVLTFPIKKGTKKGAEACTAQAVLEMLNDADYKLVITLGLATWLNAGGYSKVEKGDAEAALAVAAERIQQLYQGELRVPTGYASLRKKGKAISDRAVATEANRLAKEQMKQLIRDAGKKVTHFKASDIAKAAKELLDDEAYGPTIIEEARKNVEARVKNKAEADKAKPNDKAEKTISLLGLKEDPESKAKAEARSKEKKAKETELKGVIAGSQGLRGSRPEARH